jgi:hypothetical protein
MTMAATAARPNRSHILTPSSLRMFTSPWWKLGFCALKMRRLVDFAPP